MINADAASVFAAICRICGGNDWYAGDVLYRIRGWRDILVGGPGLRRGRRHSERVDLVKHSISGVSLVSLGTGPKVYSESFIDTPLSRFTTLFSAGY